MVKSAIEKAPITNGMLWPNLRDYWHVVAWSEDVRENEIYATKYTNAIQQLDIQILDKINNLEIKILITTI